MSLGGRKKDLSRRERQIMDALYRLGKASANEIQAAIPDPPTSTAVRTMLTKLEAKGHVRFHLDGRRYIYEPIVSHEEMGKRAMEDVVTTFFQGSIERVVANLLNREESEITDEQLNALSALIEQARREGR
jgi:predicted transcriptional regulator